MHADHTTDVLLNELKKHGQLTAIQILDLGDRERLDGVILVDVVRILVTVGLVVEISLSGDQLRGDRLFCLRRGWDGNVNSLSNLHQHVELEERSVDASDGRIQKLEKILSRQAQLPVPLSKTIFEEIVDPETDLSKLAVYQAIKDLVSEKVL